MTALVENVTGADVAAILGRTEDLAFVQGIAQLAADTARQAASAHTRGVGFEDDDQTPASLRHVVLMRAVRIVGNVQQLTGEQRDGVTLNYGTAGQGFTLQEVLALEQYRRTAC
jgi:hypothetical protein